ncbi:MAG: hypothetical protein JWP74_3312 [Marmoricola sp.]|nr:hypothetical protein [Marmoricola sp.]
MRAAVVFLVVLFLVNLPVAHEKWIDHRVAGHGHHVAAIVLGADELHGHYLVSYRLPRSEDKHGTRFSASVDESTYELARETHRLDVLAVSGKPDQNRPVGMESSSLFTVIADAVLLLIALGAWYRRRHPGRLLAP